jgi:hypothetical protein
MTTLGILPRKLNDDSTLGHEATLTLVAGWGQRLAVLRAQASGLALVVG